ncbi:hypothetical protein QY881_03275 [Latilactobacillus sakei]|uniref:hypothetical protein n=1 Tax=Latilactobacillus sakei TaxID=1599 RepID=UPI000C1262F6|nr:hypothetical protein [Latilactobacillus sakei]MCE8501551.1 hypothetical protein [Latilactobacillus sakei]MCM1635420.1 hypothetical protein [Latilactobacillus sakei]MCP8851889.1 hypothetical protein [Latilactobacillus sakei]PKX60645.1 hypothetical protein CUR39_08540 [Latilactobacillus sakei]PKX70987.1 hypothetical protein CUR36_00345 [Latilactobacillus sakei]
MTENDFSPEIQSLVAQVQANYPQPIKIRVAQEASGMLKHDQAQRVMNDDGSLAILLTDATAVDYSLSHELLHLLLLSTGFPQVLEDVTTENVQLDEQLMATGMTLYNAAVHTIIQQEQVAHGFVDTETKQAYLEGFRDNMTPEKDDPENQWVIYRVLTLLDALVFFDGGNQQLDNQWTTDYPVAYPQAQILYQVLQRKTIDSPFTLRRAVINLWVAFDRVLETLGFAATNLQQLLTLTPVLSERQLRLDVRQVYDILHSDHLLANKTQQMAYVGIGKSDQQNAFVLSVSDKEATPEYFQRLYDLSVRDFLNEIEMPYSLR